MSRIGNKIIEVPAGVTVDPQETAVLVKGPKGSLRVDLPKGIRFEKKDGRLLARRENDELAALHGLARSLVANAVGYSHPIEYPIPEGLTITVDKQTHIVVQGSDRRLVGQVAAEIRGLRPPDPYKNKGIRYTGERLKKKVGKAVGAAGGAAGGAK
jgi:large subunit ribosomal protein L6